MTPEHRRAFGFLTGSLLVCLAVLALYLPTAGDYWIRYDNEGRIREASWVRALTLEGPERSQALVEMFTGATEDQYQPFHGLSLAIDHALFGWNRAGYHAHSIALYAASMVALFVLALRLVGSWSAASLAALAVAVHPLMIEAVYWTVHRNQLLALLWTMLATNLYLTYARNPRRRSWNVVSTLAYAISLMCKVNPSVILLPFLIDLWQMRRITLRSGLEKLPLALAAIVLSIVNLVITRSQSEGPERSWPDLLAEAPAALALNAANTIFPDRIALFYPSGSAWQLVGLRWIAVLAVASLLLALGVRLWRRGDRGLLLGTAVWAPLVAPNLAAALYREYVTADRYACLALVFLGLGLAAGLARLFTHLDRADLLRSSWMRSGAAARLAVIALLVLLGSTARVETRKWSDEAQLWETVVARTPHPTAYGAMANVFKERGQWFEAVAALERAVATLKTHPRQSLDPVYHFNLTEFSLKAAEVARASGDAKREDLARHYLELAVRSAEEGCARWPELVELRYDLGWALLELGDYERAADSLATTLQQSPAHYRARARLAIAQQRLGQLDLAVAGLEDSLRSNPRYPPALSSLAEIYMARQRFTRAAQLLLVLSDVSPSSPEVHGRLLAAVEAGAEAGDAEQAEAILQRYLTRFPDSAPANSLLERLGAAHARSAPAPARSPNGSP